MENLRDTYLTLITKAEEANAAYRAGDESPLTDEQYDLLIEQLEEIGVANDWDEHLALTTKVAGGLTPENADVVHRVRMLSLSKAQNAEDLEKFINRVELHKGTLLLEPKLDGLAIVASYLDGELKQVATRGDSRVGQNITAQAMKARIEGLPKKIDYKGDLEVRGELFITRSNFNIAQHYRQKHGRENYKNPRGAVAGAIQSKDETRLEGLTFTFGAYDYIPYTGEDATAETYTQLLKSAAKYGFITAASLMPEIKKKTLHEQLEMFGAIRNSLNIPTDGAVVKVDDMALRTTLGSGERHPHWAIAYKYEAEIKETTLLSINRYVGRTGAISYVANVEPVQLSETEVSNATLNNARFISELDLRIGDVVLMRKANEIIPEILSVNLVARTGKNLPRYVAPTTCPKCGKDLDTESSVVWRCQNPECTKAASILHAVSRENLDVEGLSTSLIDRLVEEGYINDVTDLFSLSVQKLAGLPLGRFKKSADGLSTVPITLGEKTAQKIYANIQKSLEQPLNRVLSSLGIRFLGRTFGRRFAAHFKSFDAAVNATVAQMQEVEGVKDKAVVIREELDRKQALLAKYRAVGFAQMVAAVPAAAASAKLTGQSVVVTGSVPGYTRDSVKELIEKHGGNAGSSVSARTTLLVAPADERATSKAKKATDLGIRIVTPEEFLALLK